MKHGSEAPWVRKIGNPSSQENLVMMSAYAQASKRLSVHPYRLAGGVSRDNTHCHPYGKLRNSISFRGGLFLEMLEKHSFLFARSTNDQKGCFNVSR